MANPTKLATDGAKQVVAGATNLKMITGVVVGGAILFIGGALLMKKYSDKKLVKDVRDGLTG